MFNNGMPLPCNNKYIMLKCPKQHALDPYCIFATYLLIKFMSYQWASSSVYYLLGLWSRLVTSVPYLKGEAPSLLDEFVPKITEGFITSRFNSVQVCFVFMIDISL